MNEIKIHLNGEIILNEQNQKKCCTCAKYFKENDYFIVFVKIRYVAVIVLENGRKLILIGISDIPMERRYRSGPLIRRRRRLLLRRTLGF